MWDPVEGAHRARGGRLKLPGTPFTGGTVVAGGPLTPLAVGGRLALPWWAEKMLQREKVSVCVGGGSGKLPVVHFPVPISGGMSSPPALGSGQVEALTRLFRPTSTIAWGCSVPVLTNNGSSIGAAQRNGRGFCFFFFSLSSTESKLQGVAQWPFPLAGNLNNGLLSFSN